MLKHVVTWMDRNILKLSYHVRTEATKYMIRNPVQIFSVKNFTEASEVTLTTHQAHLFIIQCIQFDLRSLCKKTVAELKAYQYPKQKQCLVPNS